MSYKILLIFSLFFNFLISQVYISGNSSTDNIYLTETDSSYCTDLYAVALDDNGQSLGNIPITFSITNSEYGFLSENTVHTSADTTSYFLATNVYCTIPGISPPDILTTVYVQIEAPNPNNPNTNLSDSFSFNLIKEYEITSPSVSIESSYNELPVVLNDGNIFSSIITATATDSLGQPIYDNTLFIFKTLNDTLNQVGSIDQIVFSDNGQATSLYSLNYPVNFIGNQTISVEVPQFNIADSLNICIQAQIDECGVCNGSGPQENFDCYGNCIIDIDCSGECGGSSIIDECGVCDGPGPINECGCENEQSQCRDLDGDGWGTSQFTYTTCDIEGDMWVTNCEDLDDSIYCESNENDCSGVLCGDTIIDECGVCEGDNSSCLDCAGTPNGDALEDNCGVCDNDSSNDCIQDCAGEWGGSAIIDECGICNGNGIQDYYADWDGDGYGDCDSIYPFCPNDAASWASDICGDCDNGDANAVIIDCAGVCGGSAIADCSGECNGDSAEDECAVCDNDPSNDCEQDCDGTWGGDALEDCVGVCGGDSYIDECGVCNGTIYPCPCFTACDLPINTIYLNVSPNCDNGWSNCYEADVWYNIDTNFSEFQFYFYDAIIIDYAGGNAEAAGLFIDYTNLDSGNGFIYANDPLEDVNISGGCGTLVKLLFWYEPTGLDLISFFNPTTNNNFNISYYNGIVDECEESMLGDVNADENINVVDIVILVGLILDNSDYIETGDMNEDGQINVVDVVLLVNQILSP
tara:strand:- start:59 stop:2311 length:2253 start_codon:yes stop_codon:yes gene_type:complete